jgi:hypothetical protein
MVASRGPGGPLNPAGLAQANIVMFFFGMFAISYVTTGTVFAKTRQGYQKFRLVTLLTGFTVVMIQTILCTPALAHLLFGKIIGLPASIEQPARIAFLVSIPSSFSSSCEYPISSSCTSVRPTARQALQPLAL